MNHTWETCAQCGPFVRCGYCGNNCCNGGTGTLPNGERCGCEEAYEIQQMADEYQALSQADGYATSNQGTE